MSLELSSTKNDWNQAFMLYQGFLKLDQISELTGIPEDLLIARAKKYNWYKNRQLAQMNAEKGLSQKLQKRIEDHKIRHQEFVLDQLSDTQEVIEGMEKTEGNLFTVLGALEKHDAIARKTLKLDEEQKQDPNAIGFHLLMAMSKSLVNDNKKPQLDIESEIVEQTETDALRSHQNDPCRRSIPFDNKNDSKPILTVLNGIPIEEKTVEMDNSPEPGTQKPLFEFQAKPRELKFIEP